MTLPRYEMGSLPDEDLPAESPLYHWYEAKIPFTKEPTDGKLTTQDRGYVKRGGIVLTAGEADQHLKDAVKKCQDEIREITGG